MLEVKVTSLSKYLQTLINLDILEREVPITEENPEKSKKGLYKIKDNYLRFWFAFIYPNRGFIESGNESFVLDKIQKRFISSQAAFVYEDVCREKMWELNANSSWPFCFSKVGRWWNSEEKIDIAALDPDGNNLILGECKFWQEPVDVSVLRSLEEKAYSVEWRKQKRKVWFILFSISGYTDELQQIAANRNDLILSE